MKPNSNAIRTKFQHGQVQNFSRVNFSQIKNNFHRSGNGQERSRQKLLLCGSCDLFTAVLRGWRRSSQLWRVVGAFHSFGSISLISQQYWEHFHVFTAVMGAVSVTDVEKAQDELEEEGQGFLVQPSFLRG